MELGDIVCCQTGHLWIPKLPGGGSGVPGVSTIVGVQGGVGTIGAGLSWACAGGAVCITSAT